MANSFADRQIIQLRRSKHLPQGSTEVSYKIEDDNHILAEGEPFYDTDKNRFYIGNGVNKIKELTYVNYNNGDNLIALINDEATQGKIRYSENAGQAANAEHANNADNATNATNADIAINDKNGNDITKTYVSHVAISSVNNLLNTLQFKSFDQTILSTIVQEHATVHFINLLADTEATGTEIQMEIDVDVEEAKSGVLTGTLIGIGTDDCQYIHKGDIVITNDSNHWVWQIEQHQTEGDEIIVNKFDITPLGKLNGITLLNESFEKDEGTDNRYKINEDKTKRIVGEIGITITASQPAGLEKTSLMRCVSIREEDNKVVSVWELIESLKGEKGNTGVNGRSEWVLKPLNSSVNAIGISPYVVQNLTSEDTQKTIKQIYIDNSDSSPSTAENVFKIMGEPNSSDMQIGDTITDNQNSSKWSVTNVVSTNNPKQFQITLKWLQRFERGTSTFYINRDQWKKVGGTHLIKEEVFSTSDKKIPVDGDIIVTTDLSPTYSDYRAGTVFKFVYNPEEVYREGYYESVKQNYDIQIGINATSKQDLLNVFYPVGSYFWTSNKNTDPATLMGGVWERITDTFVRASKSSSKLVDGGSNEITLTKSNLPSHNHGQVKLRGQIRDIATQPCHPRTLGYNRSSNVKGDPTFNSDHDASPYGINVRNSDGAMMSVLESSGNVYAPAYDSVMIWEPKNDNLPMQLKGNNGAERNVSCTVQINATHTHSDVGDGKKFTAIPKYKEAYCWHRTA